MHIMKALTSAVIVLAAACSGAPQAVAQNNEPARTITVNGEGRANAAPDMAVLSIGVQTEAKTAADALRQNSAEMRATIETLKELGVEGRDIQTSGLSVNPVYDHQRDRANPPIIAYRASNTLTVRLRNLDNAGAVIDEAVQSGANRLGGVTFTFANPEPLYEEARREAVAEAQAMAALLTDAAGVRLGKLVSIGGGHVSAPGPRPMMARMEAAGASVPIEAGEASITASVTLVYEID